jgi:hypothetical protein
MKNSTDLLYFFGCSIKPYVKGGIKNALKSCFLAPSCGFKYSTQAGDNVKALIADKTIETANVKPNCL